MPYPSPSVSESAEADITGKRMARLCQTRQELVDSLLVAATDTRNAFLRRSDHGGRIGYYRKGMPVPKECGAEGSTSHDVVFYGLKSGTVPLFRHQPDKSRSGTHPMRRAGCGWYRSGDSSIKDESFGELPRLFPDHSGTPSCKEAGGLAKTRSGQSSDGTATVVTCPCARGAEALRLGLSQSQTHRLDARDAGACRGRRASSIQHVSKYPREQTRHTATFSREQGTDRFVLGQSHRHFDTSHTKNRGTVSRLYTQLVSLRLWSRVQLFFCFTD